MSNFKKVKKMLERSKTPIDLISMQSQLWKNSVRDKTRKEIDIRGLCCEICGSSENLTRHHEEYRRKNYLHPMRVRILCRDCHDKIELAKKKVKRVL